MSMKFFAALTLTVVATTVGCNPNPVKLPCETYVGGSFTPENHYALSVDATGWPQLDKPNERIELTFFLANPRAHTLDLVHVLNSQELERWTLHIPASEGLVPSCAISPAANLSSCSASIHILPHSASGYYYLRSSSELLEAGMSFVLCR